jgi:translation initiation factor IF-2
MRARGATVTDIVVLVVAADDGVMPQTIEAINHSRAAEVPIIVAVNKMDKAGADPDRVMRELAEQGLTPEDWGGDTIFVRVSAKQTQGIDDLLEMILLQAEVLELQANPEKHARGYVVESKLDSGRGPVATILIQEGTLHAGDPIVCGIHHGKIRAMLNDRGVQVDDAGPAIPVEILGLSGVPNAGDELVALDDDKSAKQVSEHRLQKHRALELAKTSRVSLEKLFERMQEGEVKELNVVLKADVHGSIEALSDSLTKLSNEEVTIQIIHAATGTVSESDISLAAVSNAIIIGFNVRPSAKVQTMASEEHVDMRFYNVIYNVIKDVKDAIVGMMESTFEERVLGWPKPARSSTCPRSGPSRAAMSPAAASGAGSGSAWSATASSSTRARSPRSSGTRMTPRRSRADTSAASASRAIMTSRWGTSLNASTLRRSNRNSSKRLSASRAAGGIAGDRYGCRHRHHHVQAS